MTAEIKARQKDLIKAQKEKIRKLAKLGKLKTTYKWGMYCMENAETGEVLIQFGTEKTLEKWIEKNFRGWLKGRE